MIRIARAKAIWRGSKWNYFIVRAKDAPTATRALTNTINAIWNICECEICDLFDVEEFLDSIPPEAFEKIGEKVPKRQGVRDISEELYNLLMEYGKKYAKNKNTSVKVKINSDDQKEFVSYLKKSLKSHIADVTDNEILWYDEVCTEIKMLHLLGETECAKGYADDYLREIDATSRLMEPSEIEWFKAVKSFKKFTKKLFKTK